MTGNGKRGKRVRIEEYIHKNVPSSKPTISNILPYSTRGCLSWGGVRTEWSVLSFICTFVRGVCWCWLYSRRRQILGSRRMRKRWTRATSNEWRWCWVMTTMTTTSTITTEEQHRNNKTTINNIVLFRQPSCQRVWWEKTPSIHSLIHPSISILVASIHLPFIRLSIYSNVYWFLNLLRVQIGSTLRLLRTKHLHMSSSLLWIRGSTDNNFQPPDSWK